MATTITIPSTALTVGPHTVGPATVQTTDAKALLTVDRTVANGLNATPTTSLDVHFEYSTDGGTTWQFLAGATGVTGGNQLDNRGNPATAWDLGAALPGLSFQLRGSVTVHTTGVTIAGSIVLS